MSVTLTPNGLEINGKFVPVYSGTVHYWRLDRELWDPILKEVQRLGFNMIETYIPWSVHETAPGQYDWGETDPRKNVEAFMELCEARGMWLLVRPGPLINAELTDFGFPEWVLMDPKVQARTALDTIHYDAAWGLHPPHQFPVPSYASETFYEYVRGWFDALGPIMARHLALAPAADSTALASGCIVAVQSDNETCYLFHDETYATDYSPDSLQLYRSFLQSIYGTVDALNAAYHTDYAAFAQVEPPRDCEIETRADVPRHLDWVRYKEYQVRYSVSRFARMLRECGVHDVPIFHDVAYQYEPPLDIVAMQDDPEIDWVGMNLYRNKEDYAGAVKRIRYLRGVTPTPFVPEFGAGLWSHHKQMFTPDEHEFITLSALMHGLKAFNFYMLVERERWTASPLTRFGKRRADYADFYERLTAFLNEQRFWEFDKQRDTIVLFNFDAERYHAITSTLHYAHVDLLGLPPELFDVTPDLGLKWDPKAEATITPHNWLGTVTGWLDAQHIAYDLGDTHLDRAALRRYAHVCVPTVDFQDPESQQELLAYAEAGGHVIFGPGLPYLTPALTQCEVLAKVLDAPGRVAHGAGCVTWLPTAQLAQELPGHFTRPEYACDAPIDLVVQQNGAGCTLLFAANHRADTQHAALSFRGTRALTPRWAGAPALRGEGTVSFSIPPHTVWVWEVTCD